MILRELMPHRNDGFFVDIGAFDPVKYSNTNFFYQRGWNGINIEPSPDALMRFEKYRKRDQNLNLGISDRNARLDYFFYAEPALNTFDPDRVRFLKKTASRSPLGQVVVKVDTLASVLGQYANSRKIDFMNIDVEGHELQVLRSNDWKKYRPCVVMIEILKFNLKTILKNPTHKFLNDHGYEFLCKTPRTSFYGDTRLEK